MREMAAMTIKMLICDALEDLSQLNLEKFIHQLLDRREEPRIRRSKVEGKNFMAVTDVIVSTFREDKGLLVTIETLKKIKCNEEARGLESQAKTNGHMGFIGHRAAPNKESRTKALIDKGVPAFRRTSAGELDVGPSQEALRRKRAKRRSWIPAKTAQEVEMEAMERVHSEGGSPDWDSTALVLSRYTLQFGQYKGQTFKWLLENDLQYAAYIITDDESEGPQHRRKGPDPLMDNKNSLRKYAMAYREFRKVRSLRLAQNGDALVGFGKYKQVKLRELYQDPDGRSYVNFLLNQEICFPGSLMEVAIDYILDCDQRGASAGHAPTRHKYLTEGRNPQQTRR